VRKGIWQIKRSELSEEELEWVKKASSERDKAWRRKNEGVFQEKRREYYRKNKDRLNTIRRAKYQSLEKYRGTSLKRHSEWYQKNQKTLTGRMQIKYSGDAEYRSRILERNRKWRKNNPEKLAQYALKKYHQKLKFDVQYTIKQRLSGQIYKAVKRGGGVKSAKTRVLCGCSIADLMAHLQSQFKEGMHWNNYGKWHIDHIRPCASFDLTDSEQQRQCFHYTNLQPLWARENIQKGARLITT
jgi:hypothetical protein